MDNEIEMLLASPFAFSGINSSFEEAKIIIYGAPLDATTSFKPGTRFGPNAIREASLKIDCFSLDKKSNFFEKVKIRDIGDVLISPGSIPETLKRIEQMNRRLKELGKIPFVLGGEHTISIGAIRAFKEENPIVIHFDAHSDLREEYFGDKVCHATAIKRVLDFLPKKNLMQIGIRSLGKEELDFVKKENIRSVFIDELKKNFGNVKNELAEKTSGKKVYITMDIDVLDCSLAPGTGTPEPNGLSYQELIELIRSVRGKLIGLDLVEVARDQEFVTPSVAAKILYEVLAQDF